MVRGLVLLFASALHQPWILRRRLGRNFLSPSSLCLSVDSEVKRAGCIYGGNRALHVLPDSNAPSEADHFGIACDHSIAAAAYFGERLPFGFRFELFALRLTGLGSTALRLNSARVCAKERLICVSHSDLSGTRRSIRSASRPRPRPGAPSGRPASWC